jgi:hypothetical protein
MMLAPGQRAYQAMIAALPSVPASSWTPWAQLPASHQAAMAAAEAVPPAPKRWYKSRTLWVNAFLLSVAMLADAVLALPALQGVLPVSVYSVLAFVLPVVNAALRFVTTTGLVK